MSNRDKTDLMRLNGARADSLLAEPDHTMSPLVASFAGNAANSAKAAVRRSRARPELGKLLRALAGKRNLLISTHRYPDPDALASAWALSKLLGARLPDAKITVSVKGSIGAGINESFVKHSNLKLEPWSDEELPNFDAIILTDVQPHLSYSPLPDDVEPLAVIDHHRTGHKPTSRFSDIRKDVGASCSIIFSYFMEAQEPISPDLAATMLYAIESDLAGAAGQPGDLDNLALSSLTLLANPRKLYQMRYAPLPQIYYSCCYTGLRNAVSYDNAIVSHVDEIDTPEKPAVIADFLVRYEPVQWAMVTSLYENRLVISIRTRCDSVMKAAEMIQRLVRKIGEGGGHAAKAGGFLPLETGDDAEIDRKRKLLRRRFLRALRIKSTPGKRLVKTS